VLVNLIKLRVRSVKDSCWIYVQKPNRSRELGAKVTRHKRDANHYRVLRGSNLKAAILSSSFGLAGREPLVNASPVIQATRARPGLRKKERRATRSWGHAHHLQGRTRVAVQRTCSAGDEQTAPLGLQGLTELRWPGSLGDARNPKRRRRARRATQQRRERKGAARFLGKNGRWWSSAAVGLLGQCQRAVWSGGGAGFAQRAGRAGRRATT
jgi:hypothetical protein